MKVFLGVVCLATLLYESHAFYYPLSITPHITSWGTFSGHEQSHEVRVGRLSRTCSMKRISYQALSFTNLRMSSTTPISTDGKARITLAKQFILASSSLNALEDIEPFLAENVECVAAESVRAVGKQAYLSQVGKELAALYRAMPDLQTSSYGYDLDDADPNTVWLKIRQRGTLTGIFSYDGEVYPGNNKVVEFPVEMWSISVQGSKIIRITRGYVVDRTTGNTRGLPGIKGTLAALGEAPSVALYLPLPVALKRFFGRNRKSPSKLSSGSPFPFPVMKSLAEQIVSTEFGLKSPELLTNDFLYSSPFDGPLTKKEFLGTKGSLTNYIADSDVPLKFSNAHLDPFEPDRVWLTFYPKSVRKEYKGAPEVIGVSINNDGLCYKVTAGYISDRSKSIRGALVGGDYGYRYTSPLSTKSIRGLSLAIAEAFVPKSTTNTKATQKLSQPPRGSSPPSSSVGLNPKSSSSSMAAPKAKVSTAKRADKKPSVPVKTSMKPAVNATSTVEPSLVPKKTASPAPSKPPPKSASSSSSLVTLPKFSFGRSTATSEPVKQSLSTAKMETKGENKKDTKGRALIAKKNTEKQDMNTRKEAKEKANARARKEAPEKQRIAGKIKDTTQQKTEAMIRNKKAKDLGSLTDRKAKEREEKRKQLDRSRTKSEVSIPASSSLSKKLVTIIIENNGNVSKVETAVKLFLEDKIQNEKFCKEIIAGMGSVDAAVAVLPDIIGSLPRSDRKSKLNQYFQQQL